MGDVIDFLRAREKRGETGSGNLNDLIKRASLICKEKLDESGIIRTENLKHFFESRINQEIFNRHLIGSDIFLCGIYVSNLLTDLATNTPESWWAVDYAISGDSSALKKGGDVCFVICGVFPERGNYRLMDVSYYRKMGEGFYYQLYSVAKREIGYHMSHQFGTMVTVVQGCINNF